MRRFEQLKAQYNAIMRNNTQYDYSELCVSAITSDFDRIFELAWKTLKEYLWKELGVAGAKSGSPREILGLAFQYCLINKEELWIAMLQDRNDDAHIYSKAQAILYKSRIEEQYLPVVGELIDELAEQIPNGEAIPNVEIPDELIRYVRQSHIALYQLVEQLKEQFQCSDIELFENWSSIESELKKNE